MPDNSFFVPTDFFKCLSDPYRLLCMIMITKHHRLCVCDLMKILDLPQPKVSRYLSDLRKCRLLISEKKAQWVYYQLSPDLPVFAKEILNHLSNEKLHGLPPYKPFTSSLDCEDT